MNKLIVLIIGFSCLISLTSAEASETERLPFSYTDYNGIFFKACNTSEPQYSNL